MSNALRTTALETMIAVDAKITHIISQPTALLGFVDGFALNPGPAFDNSHFVALRGIVAGFKHFAYGVYPRAMRCTKLLTQQQMQSLVLPLNQSVLVSNWSGAGDL